MAIIIIILNKLPICYFKKRGSFQGIFREQSIALMSFL